MTIEIENSITLQMGRDIPVKKSQKKMTISPFLPKAQKQ